MKEQKLTQLQREILDCLANDYENLEQTYTMLTDKTYSKADIRENVEFLVKKGYLKCFESTDAELVEVQQPDFSKIDTYWFDLSEEGKNIVKGVRSVSHNNSILGSKK